MTQIELKHITEKDCIKAWEGLATALATLKFHERPHSDPLFHSKYSKQTLGFADALGVNRNNDVAMHQVDCGLHSGLPVCCIEFFVTAWWPLAMLGQHEAMSCYNQLRADLGVSCDYIPCPDCLAKREFVKVERCNCDDRMLADQEEELL